MTTIRFDIVTTGADATERFKVLVQAICNSAPNEDSEVDLVLSNTSASTALDMYCNPWQVDQDVSQRVDQGALTTITSVDLSAVGDVTSVGAFFLCNCSGKLYTPNMSSLRKVVTVGECFMRGCYLRSLDLGWMANVTQVGDGFLDGCSGPESLDLTALTNLTIVGRDFLRGCRLLKTLDLTGLRNVTAVDRFLNGCSGLETLDLAALTNLADVGDRFLAECSGLSTLDLSRMTSVTSVGDAFLLGCSGLKSLRVCENLLRSGAVEDKDKALQASRQAAAAAAAVNCATCAAEFDVVKTKHVCCPCDAVCCADCAPDRGDRGGTCMCARCYGEKSAAAAE